MAQELKNIDASENLETAVLLADESLLIPTLNAFDEEIDAPNISMGYSIKNTAIFSFVEEVTAKSDVVNFCVFQSLLELERHAAYSVANCTPAGGDEAEGWR